MSDKISFKDSSVQKNQGSLDDAFNDEKTQECIVSLIKKHDKLRHSLNCLTNKTKKKNDNH